MAVRFPVTCKLSPAERDMLSLILVEGDSPCDGCSWAADCDGPTVERKMVDAILDDPDGHCLICGGDIGRRFESKLVPGTFSFCAQSVDEYVFRPCSRADQVVTSDDIEF